MADVFIEHMITRYPTAKSRLIKVGILLGVLLVNALMAVLLLFFQETVAFMVPPVLVCSIWFGYKLVRRQHTEIEYILTNGEMDVDKIMDRSTRKRLVTVDCRSFETLAPYKPAFLRDYQNMPATIDASSGSENANRYFAVYPGKDGKRTLLIFDPNERMMDAFSSFIPRKIQQ